MARHAKEEASKDSTVVERKRKDALEKFFGLSAKAMKHIEWSLESKVICAMCASDPVTGEHKPGKAKDETGKCAFCHGTGYVPDKEQRNWATGQVADRIAPKPKSVEMNIEQTSTLVEIEKDMQGKSDDELKRIIAQGQVLMLSELPKAS